MSGNPSIDANSISFVDCEFYGVTIIGLHFGSAKISFSNCKFTGDFRASELKFNNRPHFDSSQFLGDVKLGAMETRQGVSFRGCEFHEEVEFRNALLASHEFDADFTGARFLKPAKFIRSRFLAKANFVGAIFESNVSFHEAQFDKDAAFDRVQFRGASNFSSSPSTEKEQKVGERKDTFRNVTFAGADFGAAGVTFADRKFLGRTDFKHATFRSAPVFHGCAFHQDSDFGGIKFTDITSVDAYKGYRTIAALASQIGDRKLEFLAYHREQQSLRKAKIVGGFDRLVSWCYDKFYACGTSMARPVVAQIAWLLFAPLMLLYVVNVVPTPLVEAQWFKDLSLSDAYGFIWQQTVRPLSVWARDVDWIGGLKFAGAGPWPFRVIGTVTSLFTFLNLFMFGLAARRIFKMGSTSA